MYYIEPCQTCKKNSSFLALVQFLHNGEIRQRLVIEIDRFSEAILIIQNGQFVKNLAKHYQE